jgi:hypothetical protein
MALSQPGTSTPVTIDLNMPESLVLIVVTGTPSHREATQLLTHLMQVGQYA